ncbi:MAG: pentapeptide repeat-containing protein [Deltaproteobacteria bacterium]|nr:pentapeptide repeat-containing protein [Deltaproteobacteria bacterium]
MTDLSNTLKSASRREPDRYFHVLIMTGDGQTRRLSLSVSFLWIMGSLALLVLGSLGLVAYLWVEAVHTRDSLSDRLEYVSRQTEMNRYNQDIKAAPDQARRLLEELDLAVRSADASENGEVVKGVALDSAELPASAGGAAANLTAANAAAGNLTSVNLTSVNLTSVNLTSANLTSVNLTSGNLTSGNLTSNAPAGNQTASEAAAGPAENLTVPAAGNSSAAIPPAAAAGPKTPEEEAWAKFWASWPPVPPPSSLLDVDDFKVTGAGEISFILRQIEGPGQRARGRSVTVCAVADRSGQVKIVPAPDFNLAKPAEGYNVGSRYNILSSKVVRGKIAIPPGGKFLGAEVLAFDEDSRELVLRKKIVPEESR